MNCPHTVIQSYSHTLIQSFFSRTSKFRSRVFWIFRRFQLLCYWFFLKFLMMKLNVYKSWLWVKNEPNVSLFLIIICPFSILGFDDFIKFSHKKKSVQSVFPSQFLDFVSNSNVSFILQLKNRKLEIQGSQRFIPVKKIHFLSRERELMKGLTTPGDIKTKRLMSVRQNDWWQRDKSLGTQRGLGIPLEPVL